MRSIEVDAGIKYNWCKSQTKAGNIKISAFHWNKQQMQIMLTLCRIVNLPRYNFSCLENGILSMAVLSPVDMGQTLCSSVENWL